MMTVSETFHKYVTPDSLRLRPYRPGDLDDVLRLFRTTVHTVNKRDYSPAQLDAWAPENPDRIEWNRSLLQQHCIIAEVNEKIAGFGDAGSGYIDRLYVHEAFLHRGIGTQLADELEQHATRNGEKQIFVDASITARPFFIARGYETICMQQVERNSIFLTNFKMKKKI